MSRLNGLWKGLGKPSTLQLENVTRNVQRLINEVTGYDACEQLKENVKQKDHEYTQLKHQTKASKISYYQTIGERAKCQRELNALLQRKHLWNEEDVNRFTQLYKQEMRLESLESQGLQETEVLEAKLDDLHLGLMNAMRERYQEEQLWSDKIRKISAYGTIGLLSVNIGLFLVVHFWIEPRKKAKLLQDLARLIPPSPADTTMGMKKEIGEIVALVSQLVNEKTNNKVQVKT